MERILLIKLVKVLITDLRGNLRNVARRHLTELVPLQVFEKWMGLDLFDAISAESSICITNQPFQDISGSW